MTARILTFVFGFNYWHAGDWIHAEIRRTGRASNEFRNITNPDSVRGLGSDPKLTIEFVWCKGCERNPGYDAMYNAVLGRRGRGIVERHE